MKILAIEASSLVCSTAILTDDIITAEYTINNKVTHSQTLLPMIDEICKMTDTDVSEFDAIAVSGVRVHLQDSGLVPQQLKDWHMLLTYLLSMCLH